MSNGYDNTIEIDLDRPRVQAAYCASIHLLAMVASLWLADPTIQMVVVGLIAGSFAIDVYRIKQWPWQILIWKPSGALLAQSVDGVQSLACWKVPPHFGLAWVALRFEAAGRSWYWIILRKPNAELCRLLAVRSSGGDQWEH